MNILKSVALIAAAFVALAGCQKAGPDVAAVSDEVKRGVRDWVTLYTAGDADGIAAKYSEDAIVMAPGAPAAVGRDAIRYFLAGDSANSKAAGIKLVISDGDLVGVSGDLAWHSGGYVVNDASGATIDSGHYLEVLQNFDGKLLIIRDTWNSDRAPAVAPAAEATAEAPAA